MALCSANMFPMNSLSVFFLMFFIRSIYGMVKSKKDAEKEVASLES